VLTLSVQANTAWEALSARRSRRTSSALIGLGGGGSTVVRSSRFPCA